MERVDQPPSGEAAGRRSTPAGASRPGDPRLLRGVRDGATATALPRPESLARVLDDAVRQGRVVVVLFSLPGCPYCEALRREQLVHLARDAAREGVAVAEFDLTDSRRFPDTPATALREGGVGTAAALQAGSAADLARALGVTVAPTVVFLGKQGELADRLVGYASSDFYGAYLEQRIGAARQRAAGAQPGATARPRP